MIIGKKLLHQTNSQQSAQILSIEQRCLKRKKQKCFGSEYLLGIKGNLKTWIRVIRDFHYPNLTKEFTEEQKADIMRRFKEVEKYTVTPPYFPGGRN